MPLDSATSSLAPRHSPFRIRTYTVKLSCSAVFARWIFVMKRPMKSCVQIVYENTAAQMRIARGGNTVPNVINTAISFTIRNAYRFLEK